MVEAWAAVDISISLDLLAVLTAQNFCALSSASSVERTPVVKVVVATEMEAKIALEALAVALTLVIWTMTQ